MQATFERFLVDLAHAGAGKIGDKFEGYIRETFQRTL